MSIDFQKVHIELHTFDPGGVNEERRFFGEHTFGYPIQKAEAAINGFEVNYTQGDHNIKDICVGCDAIIDDANRGTVTARVKLKFADEGFDDPVAGWIEVILFVQSAE